MRRKRGELLRADELLSCAEACEQNRVTQAVRAVSGEDAHAPSNGLNVRRIELETRMEEPGVDGAPAEDDLGKYRSLYDLAPVGLFTFSGEGRVLEVNLAGAELLGVAQLHLVSKWFQLFVCQDSIPVFNTFCQTVFESNARQACEVRLLKGSKSSIHVRIEGVAFDGGQGTGKQCHAAIFDVTEQKLVEENLRIAQEGLDAWVPVRMAELIKANEALGAKINELEMVQETLRKEYSFRNAIISHAAEGLCAGHTMEEHPYMKFTVWNHRMTEVTGYTMQDVNRVGSIKLLFPDTEERARAIERIERLWKGDHLVSEEWEITRADGEKRIVAISASLVESGDGPVHLLALMHDVTDLRRSETALRESERYYRSLLLNLNEDILVIARDHRVQDVNKDFLASLRRGREEVIGRRCHELLHDREAPCTWHGQDCGLEKVFETGQPYNSLHEHIRADGSKIWVNSLMSPLKDETGSMTHVIGAIRDVTHEIELERQLRQAQKIEAIGTLAGGISHDFNNLLTPILIYTEMAMYKLPRESSLLGPLEEVLKSARHAKDLVQQILAFSRPTEEEMKPVEISHLLKETVKMLQSVLPKSIEIRATLSNLDQEGTGTILADPSQIHQVLMNLCTNAGHAMREGGGVLTVGLSNVELQPWDHARFPTLTPGPYVSLTVSDTGIGIDRAVLERIFDPFFTTKGPGEGTGLGLAVVYRIVKGHGGAISVSSNPGEGTTFQVLFPRVQDNITQPASGEPRSVPRGNERILLVDDEESVLGAMDRILSHLGYMVTAKINSLEALETFRAGPAAFDLVITDHNMPRMTGVELAGKIKEIRPDVPIVICTGYSDASIGLSPEACRNMGICMLLHKPVNTAEMADSVRRVLDGR